VCWNDGNARRVIDALHDCGLSVPKDVSVVGYDDDPETSRSPMPPLTTLRQAYGEQGKAAITTLEESIRAPQAAPRRVLIPATLIVRDSTAPPRQERS
jgi:DNA-binding LacI/PurR family transcriptional regulator